jgi:2-iminobutanoate/2-iminopropanoate deaminase
MQNRAMYPETIHPPLGAYAHAIEIPDGARLTYIAGQVGIDKDGVVPDDFRAQAMLAWDNCTKILAHNSMRMKDVVKITHFLTDAADIPVYREVIMAFLGEERPTSTLLVIAALARPELRIEVEMVAAIS